MPRANRVQPDGTFAAVSARGMFTGNRGILHDATGALGATRWRHKAWICCTLDLRPGRKPLPMEAPGHYTPLFFHDEAVALAAGHRPCAECRRADFRAFAIALGGLPAPEIDRALHLARLDPATRGQRRHDAMAETLPDGAFVVYRDRPCLIRGALAFPFYPAGYGPALPRPEGRLQVLTPEPALAALQAGYIPHLHPSVALSTADKSVDKTAN